MEQKLVMVTILMPAREAEIFKKMSPDEPRFTLRGQDRIAAMLVALWAMIADLVGVNQNKVQGAHEIAVAMRAWHPRKIPD